MNSETQLQTRPAQPLTLKVIFAKDDVKGRIQEMLGRKAQGFITSVLQTATNNKLLATADPMSIYNAALVAATLDLPINDSLGFAYIIPYNQRQTDGSYKQVAQFQMGYKGLIQLAQRSGQFKTIAACPIYEGQIVEANPLTGHVFDFTKKSDKLIGFAAFFKLINGFEKTLYMTVEDLKKHGLKYSKTYSNTKTRATSKWETDFEAMAIKTVLKLLLAKFAPLSIEMQKAVVADQAIVKDEGQYEYADHEEVKIDKEKERVTLLLNDCETVSELQYLQEQNPDIDIELINNRKAELEAQEGGDNA